MVFCAVNQRTLNCQSEVAIFEVKKRKTLSSLWQKRVFLYRHMRCPINRTAPQRANAVRPFATRCLSPVGAERLFCWRKPHKCPPYPPAGAVREVSYQKYCRKVHKSCDFSYWRAAGVWRIIGDKSYMTTEDFVGGRFLRLWKSWNIYIYHTLLSKWA